MTDPDPSPPTELSIPLSIEPKANPGGYVVKMWDTDTGRLMVHVCSVEMTLGDVRIPVSGSLLAIAYDGDTGALTHTTVMRNDAKLSAHGLSMNPSAAMLADLKANPELRERADEVIETQMNARLDQCAADPDELCPGCDDSVEGGISIEPALMHRECFLVQFLGPLGHVLDCDFWCENMSDPNAGKSTRDSARAVADLVAKYGVAKVGRGEFPKDAD